MSFCTSLFHSWLFLGLCCMEFDVSPGWIVIMDYPIKLPFLVCMS